MTPPRELKLPEPVWVCRPEPDPRLAACPAQPPGAGAACDVEGLACFYNQAGALDDGHWPACRLRGVRATCKGGVWSTQHWSAPTPM